jgi:cation diffusion facilitator family transporter
MEQTQNDKKENIALSSVAAGVFMTGMKLVVGLMTGSIGILSEAAHSLLDMGAAVITFFAVRASGRPADEAHPYGHGKIESISALAETVLLFITSFWIIYEASKRLIYGGIEIEVTWYAFAVVIVSILIDFSRSRALMKVARETNSQALEADAIHFQSDIWSSLVVLVGLVCVYYGFRGADAIAALGVALFVMKIGYEMGRRTFDVLIDTAPEGVEAVVKEILNELPRIIEVERVRTRTMGPTISIDAIVTISRKYHSEEVREIIDEAEGVVKERFPDADLIITAKSIAHSSETIVETIHVLAAKEKYFVHDIVVDILDNKLFVSYDLEVPAHLSLFDAHSIASTFEEHIRDEVGADAEINTHLDPTHREVIESAPLNTDELISIEQSVLHLAKKIPEFHGVHHIRARQIAGKLIVTAHCGAPSAMPIEEAHGYSETLEHLIIQSNPRIARVLIHVEPE